MKKKVSVILSSVLIFSMLSMGLLCLSDVIKQSVEKKQIDKYWAQVSEFDGEITNRLTVRSREEIDFLNAVQTASGYDNTYYLQFKNEEDTLTAQKYYESIEDVESVRRDKVMQTDDVQLYATECYATANSNIDDALKLIDEYFSDPPEIRVAVIDTGVENNDTFAGRIVGGSDSLPGEDYHGSYVAGTLLYNTPDNVKVYSYKAGSGTEISTASAAAAIDKAVSDGCDIINMSFGGEDIDLTLYKSIIKANLKGVIMLAAAGNDSKNLSVYNQYPAEFSEVFAIGSMTESKSLDTSSNYGTGIFTYATGANVRSNYRGKDIYWKGTSAATPVVAAVVANLLTVDDSLSTYEIKTCISDTAMSPNESNTSRDIVDAYAAIKNVTELELPTAQLDYTITENNETGYSEITFDCDDDTQVYYYLSRLNSGSAVVYPLDTDYFTNHYKYVEGSTITFDREYVVNAVAYSPGREKSILYHIAAPCCNENDYNYSSASKSISYCQLSQSSITVPESINNMTVTKIGAFCFAGNESVETIVLPDTITEIGEYAFSNCPNLKKVIAPGVVKCGRYAFQNCGKLMEVIMPQNDNTFTGMFKNCASLIIAQISDNDFFTSYYNKAFYGCERMMNYFALGCDILFGKVTNRGNYAYISEQQDDYYIKSPQEILYLWDSYYLNKKTSSLGLISLFDSSSLFDVNNDGIVNAKDYAMLSYSAKRQKSMYGDVESVSE